MGGWGGGVGEEARGAGAGGVGLAQGRGLGLDSQPKGWGREGVAGGWAGPGADADCGACPRPASIVCALAGQLPCFCFCLCGSCVVSVGRSYVFIVSCVPAYIAVDFHVNIS